MNTCLILNGFRERAVCNWQALFYFGHRKCKKKVGPQDEWPTSILDAAAQVKKREDQLGQTTRDLRTRVTKHIAFEGILEHKLSTLTNLLIMKVNKMHYFSNLFDTVLFMFRTGPLSIIRSISTLYTRNRYLPVDLSETCTLSNKWGKYCISLALVIRRYHDARSSKCQI